MTQITVSNIETTYAPFTVSVPPGARGVLFDIISPFESFAGSMIEQADGVGISVQIIDQNFNVYYDSGTLFTLVNPLQFNIVAPANTKLSLAVVNNSNSTRTVTIDSLTLKGFGVGALTTQKITLSKLLLVSPTIFVHRVHSDGRVEIMDSQSLPHENFVATVNVDGQVIRKNVKDIPQVTMLIEETTKFGTPNLEIAEGTFSSAILSFAEVQKELVLVPMAPVAEPLPTVSAPTAVTAPSADLALPIIAIGGLGALALLMGRKKR